jgi:hypothetical protein
MADAADPDSVPPKFTKPQLSLLVETPPALPFDGAVTRIVSRPPQPAHVTGRIPTTGPVRPTRCDEDWHRYGEVASPGTAVAIEPVAVRVELAEGIERDRIGSGRSHRSLRLWMLDRIQHARHALVSTISSSTNLFSNIRNVQRARPLGGLGQANAINLVSFSPSSPAIPGN